MQIKRLLGFVAFLSFLMSAEAQELMKRIEDSDVTPLLNNTAVVTLQDSSKLVGTVSNITLLKGALSTVTVKLQDDSKRKFKSAELISLKVRCATPTVFSMVDNNGTVMKKVINTQFVFERPSASEKKGKSEMIQLLNPAFDKKIKIFTDPDASIASSASVIRGTPKEEVRVESYLLVKGEQVVTVDRSSYGEKFNQLFSDCLKMTESIQVDNIQFEAMPGHVLLYDHLCPAGK